MRFCGGKICFDNVVKGIILKLLMLVIIEYFFFVCLCFWWIFFIIVIFFIIDCVFVCFNGGLCRLDGNCVCFKGYKGK